ncbi:MAG: glucosylceramidase [Sphingobacteriales bacterium]|nr:glucosylceramidase [Sphingobacteriales bacterium]MBI3720886.1 glucosylceramidase [Sphingobacteriales bacterium]
MKNKSANQSGIFAIIILLGMIALSCNCSKKSKSSGNPVTPPPTPAATANWWMTRGDQAVLLEKQSAISFTSTTNSNSTIEVDSTISFQSIDGFGYTLTGGSAYVINKLSSADKAALLQELFGKTGNSLAISYLRISIGASDLNSEVFSYDDMPSGQTDVSLNNFNLSKDTIDVIPLLKEIIAINPAIKILGSPWSPPVWMKTNGSSAGGSLQTQYYAAYAQYFVKYIQAMKANGITVDAITIQNEPENANNNPSMLMNANEQADFIKNNLGPAFQSAGINTKIILFDHNCDHPNYPLTILNDAAAKPYIDGSAFHLYVGDISALSSVHNAYPDKKLYFTEQWTGANGTFSGDLQWHIKNVIIGSVRNWSSVALEWNLASDASYNPHTPGGCTECKGALTISSGVSRNVSYYIIGHASRFVPPGSVRIQSNNIAGVPNAAFLTPDGKKVVIAVNESTAAQSFNIKYKGQIAVTSLPAGAVATFVW